MVLPTKFEAHRLAALGPLLRFCWGGGQVIDSLQSVRWSDGLPLEALLPSSIEHPDIVRTYAQKIVPAEGQEEHQEGVSHVWLLMEFCDLGDLGVRLPIATPIRRYLIASHVASNAGLWRRGVWIMHGRGCCNLSLSCWRGGFP